LAAVRLISDMASSGFKGSSMTMTSPPRPVNEPPTEVASPNPRAVSSISVSEFLYGPISALGKTDRYQGASITARKSLECFRVRLRRRGTQQLLF
jgi:hypothetical protein